ncbi:aspartate aminotransferase family protein [Marinobacter bohaiensis]|uniref:aspartate aminotransferase family protein n=1 Tax=Marinobacter bohaiensis TaxID=2201898 RepID=UPI000DABAEEC|nr:aspartate aminotransferase family protein [Marinobacter bohaiensis]
MEVNRALFDDVMVPNYAPPEVIPVRGEGSRVWDQEGREFIDFAGGIAVSCLGHCHPAPVRALQEQSERVWHLANVMTNEPALRLAKKLTDATFAERVYFANSGTEANEAALKLARRWAFNEYGEDKSDIISFERSFHGRTFFAVSVGGQKAYSDGFGPKPGAIHHAVYNDLASLEAVISDKTCAVMMEPLQGEGGIIDADPEFIRGVRQLCDKHNALLIFDEVQTGVGRTGHLYAYMDSGVTPDILTTAKALGAGFPIGAMLTTAAIASHLKPGTHGSTYGGNPLACAVAEATFDTVNDLTLLAGVRKRHDLFKAGLASINARYGIFREVRGKGLLIGAELVDEHAGRAKEILQAAMSEGLLCLVAGANVVRFTPSLLIPEADIEEGLNRFEAAIDKLFGQVAKAG